MAQKGSVLIESEQWMFCCSTYRNTIALPTSCCVNAIFRIDLNCQPYCGKVGPIHVHDNTLDHDPSTQKLLCVLPKLCRHLKLFCLYCNGKSPMTGFVFSNSFIDSCFLVFMKWLMK